ncbi:hypothetical protein STA1M1_41240 [Sinisalibacter aestuarii]|uniref:Alpha/beta hydrolase n=2 Tax=Sinisalibacter aestuarii TaxID=2949426 RepID=A0ABQ5LZ62_9RHOB|nr:hypothetical protein STA1M1_41240 [Sinisalibacter aestuarii]
MVAGQPNADFDQLHAGGYDARYPVTVEACEFPPGTIEVEGQTVICGTVSVPEDYARPDGNRIPLEFAIIKAASRSPAPDPLVYLHGGPGGGTLEALGPVGDLIFREHRRTRDIVAFDQRAAALSSRTVNCYRDMADHIVELAKVPAGTRELPGELLARVIDPCLEEIRASDADLTAYNTENNARDVRALMTAIGYPTYNIYGISYGTRLALEVLRTAPAGVRSVVIDGVAPSSVFLYDDLLGPYADAADALVDQCAADEVCNAAYPDLRATINAAFERLINDPVPASRGQPEINMVSLFTLAFIARNAPMEKRPITAWLPRIFAELAEGKTDAYDAISTMPQPDPTAAFGDVKGLTEDERALVRLALEGAQAMEHLDKGAVAAIERLKADLGEARETASVAEAFDARSTQAALANGDPDALTAMVQDFAMLQTQIPGPQPLIDWVEAHFTGADRETLLGLIAAMTDADFALIFESATRDASKYEALMRSAINQGIYACQEDMPYNSIEGFKARLAELGERYPFVLLFAEETGQYDKCAHFEPHPRDGFHDSVVSDVPVLALNGIKDTQTSWRWGAVAVETLPNGRNFVFPEAGHGSLIFQPCAADISVAFLNNPTAPLDASCIDDIKVDFVKPDDPLPGAR